MCFQSLTYPGAAQLRRAVRAVLGPGPGPVKLPGKKRHGPAPGQASSRRGISSSESLSHEPPKRAAGEKGHSKVLRALINSL